MTKTYNLPPFRDHAPFPPATMDIGRWMSADGTLAELAQSLRNDDENAAVGALKSVPDPWAQVRVFADQVAAGHATTLSQWRGLMALFALAQVNRGLYRITIEPVRLRAASAAGEPPTSIFERVLMRLPPRIGLPQAPRTGGVASWDAPAVAYLELFDCQDANDNFLYKDRHAIGVVNPACLVAPGRRTAERAYPGLKWLAKGLADPTALVGEAALPMGQYAIIRAWLDALHHDLEDICGAPPPESLYAGLSRELQLFRKACDAICLGTGYKTVDVDARNPDLPTLYHSLQRQTDLRPSEDPPGDSECCVALREDLGGKPFAAVILVDPAIATSRGKFTKDVRVWGNITLDDLNAPGRRTQVEREVIEQGYLLVTPEMLFSDRLCQLTHRAIVEGHGESARSQLLPLSPLALLLLNPMELAQRATIADRGGDRVAAQLSLQLANPAGGASFHRVERLYSTRPNASEGRLDRNVDWTFGETAVWPNFSTPSWQWYFLRLTYTKVGETVRARFGLSGAAFAAFLNSHPEADRAALAKRWSASTCQAELGFPLAGRSSAGEREGRWLQRLRNIDDAEVVEEYQSSDQAFEGVFFSRAAGGETAAPTGCALLQPVNPPAGGGSAVVAVDFGTTNTVACINDADPLVFADRIMHPIRSADPQRMERGRQQTRWPFAEFMPPNDRTTPTPTVGFERQRDVEKDKAAVAANTEDDRVLFGHVIYFQPDDGAAADVAASDIEKFRGILGRARFNLKWGDPKVKLEEGQQDVTKEVARRYLRQFMLMTAAEAVMSNHDTNRLTWRFSRPDAMERSKQGELLLALQQARDEVAPGSTLTHLYSEGAATAKYILSGGKGGAFNPGDLNVILDIGGGTTDVAFWARNRIVWSGSFLRLAGGQFFTEHLVNNPSFFRTFGLANWADIIAPTDTKVTRLDQAQLASVGELLFSGSRLGLRLNERWGRNSDTPDAKSLVQTAFTFLGGIAWYLGLVTKSLIERGELDAKVLNRVVFALCGRGSGLFGRLHGGGGATAESAVRDLLTLFSVAAGAEKPLPPDIFLSPSPKIEVVGGMVSKRSVPDLEDPASWSGGADYRPAGLAIQFDNNTALAADADISGRPPGVEPSEPELTELESFIDALAKYGGFRIDLRQGDSQGALARIREKVFTQTQYEKAALTEPPFIAALKFLVADMAAGRATRAQFLSISET